MSDGAPILFCPFCRECFEGEARCPEHDLLLVPFEKLPRNAEDEAADLPADDEDLATSDLRFGRGWIAAGAALLGLSFAMPFVDLHVGSKTFAFTGMTAAAQRAPNLWTVPFVAALVIGILGRRRSLRKMRGARLSMLFLSAAPLFALGYSYLHVVQGAALESARGTATMTVTPGFGIAVAIAGALVMAFGARKLGHVSLEGYAPSRADVDQRSPIITAHEPATETQASEALPTAAPPRAAKAARKKR
jgi:hypothetical protein